jgi:hypothetical protein
LKRIPCERIASAGRADAIELGLHGFALDITPRTMERKRVRPGVDLADPCTDPRRRLDLRHISIDEHARHDASAGQPVDDRSQPPLLG